MSGQLDVPATLPTGKHTPSNHWVGGWGSAATYRGSGRCGVKKNLFPYSGLRHEMSSLARTLWSWVRIPLKAWISVCVFPVFVFCLGSGLATGWSPVQGVLQTVFWLRNWSETKSFTDALCSKVGATGKQENYHESNPGHAVLRRSIYQLSYTGLPFFGWYGYLMHYHL
jgi:hypothetical protein